MKTRLLKALAILGLLLMAFGCGGGGGDDSGTGTGGTGGDTPPPVVTPSATSLDITTNNYTLNTNGADSSTLTIFTRNASNAAVGGVVVNLSATAGILNASQVTTDATGKATATFSTGPEKTNQVATVTAATGTLSKDLPITLLGTSLTVNPTKNTLLAGVSDSTTITVRALDGASNPIPNANITITSSRGNNLTAAATTATTITVRTGSDGRATATLTALATPGVDTIIANGLGTQASTTVNVTNAQFGFTSPTNGSTLATGASTPLTVTWTDPSGAPVVGQPVTFSATAGAFGGAPTVLTGAGGQATITYTASSTASPATITATAAGGLSDAISLAVAATNPARLNLQASPNVLGRSVGDVSASSVITATVRNASNQLVSDETVIFSLVSGPGGGEFISPGTAVTTTGGTASVTFTSGSAVSAQNGVRIRATLQSDPTIFADTTLTIGQSATSIVLGTTNKIAQVNVDGLNIGYALPFSVLVVDSNGNPIPNATVNLGIYPLYFYTGTASGSTATWTGKFVNEDLDRNANLDPGEDGARGWSDPTALPNAIKDSVWLDGSESVAAIVTTLNPDGTFTGTPNGKIDPGGVATIPSSVTTDSSGLAAFEVKYAKSFGNWVTVEITATTQISGDLSTSKLVVPLAVALNDTPYPDSPFGF